MDDDNESMLTASGIGEAEAITMHMLRLSPNGLNETHPSEAQGTTHRDGKRKDANVIIGSGSSSSMNRRNLSPSRQAPCCDDGRSGRRGDGGVDATDDEDGRGGGRRRDEDAMTTAMIEQQRFRHTTTTNSPPPLRAAEEGNQSIMPPGAPPASENRHDHHSYQQMPAAGQANVYVASLPNSYDTAALRRLFADCGPIVSACVFTPKHRGVLTESPLPNKAYGFVLFASAEDAKRAVERRHGTFLETQRIQVRMAKVGAPAGSDVTTKGNANDTTATHHDHHHEYRGPPTTIGPYSIMPATPHRREDLIPSSAVQTAAGDPVQDERWRTYDPPPPTAPYGHSPHLAHHHHHHHHRAVNPISMMPLSPPVPLSPLTYCYYYVPPSQPPPLQTFTAPPPGVTFLHATPTTTSIPGLVGPPMSSGSGAVMVPWSSVGPRGSYDGIPSPGMPVGTSWGLASHNAPPPPQTVLMHLPAGSYYYSGPPPGDAAANPEASVLSTWPPFVPAT